jgi:pyruvate dehydrogenase (quinone)/pyruvate decarboxylase
MKLSADERSKGNPGARSSSAWTPAIAQPPLDSPRAVADVMNSGRRVAILVGQGALTARDMVMAIADRLGAPVAKGLLGKAVRRIIRLTRQAALGISARPPSSWAMENCDTVLILGSTMPWFEYYPRPGQARGVQVDLKADLIGLRYPVEVGLVSDVKATLQALSPLIFRQSDRGFLEEAQRRMAVGTACCSKLRRLGVRLCACRW